MRVFVLLAILLLILGLYLVSWYIGPFWFPAQQDYGALVPEVPDINQPEYPPDLTPAQVRSMEQRMKYTFIAGQLYYENGLPAANIEVVVKHGRFEYRMRTLGSGDMFFQRIRIGIITNLYIDEEGYEPIHLLDIKLKAGGTTNLGRLVLRRGGVIYGTILGGDQPVPDAEVLLRDGFMNPAGRFPLINGVLADDNGFYNIEGVREGTFTLDVVAKGYARKIIKNVVMLRGDKLHKDIVLASGVSISGRVVDRLGVPVPGAKVGAYSYAKEFTLGEIDTDEYGQFVFGSLEEGQYYLWARAPGFAHQRKLLVRAPGSDIIFSLEDGGSIIGHVTFASGNPVKEFYIRCYRHEKKLEHTLLNLKAAQALHVRDDQGRFALEGLAGGEYNLEVYSDIYATARKYGVPVRAGEVTSGVSISMVTGGNITGFVKSKESGNPLQGAIVQTLDEYRGIPMGESFQKTVLTDRQGFFKLTGLPAGRVTLQARYLDAAPAIVRGIPVTMHQRETESADVTIMIEVGRSDIRGTVYNADGSGKVGALLVLQNKEQFGTFSYLKTTTADYAGEYKFTSLPPGAYMVIRVIKLPTDIQSKTVILQEGKSAIVNFGAEDTVTVFGRVTDNQEPVTGLNVLLIPQPGKSELTGLLIASLNDNGEYIFDNIRPGVYTIMVQSLTGVGRISFRNNIEVPRGFKRCEYPIRIPPSGFSGRVFDNKTGDPLRRVTVAIVKQGTQRITSLSDLADKAVSETSTDKEGYFECKGIPPGNCQLRFILNGYAVKYLDAELSRDDGMVALPDVYLDLHGYITGVVRDNNSRPVKEALFRVVDSAGNVPKLISLEKSDGAGRFYIGNLYDDTYILFAQAEGYSMQVEYNIQVRQGEETKRDVVLENGGRLRLQVEDNTGNPVEGAKVTILTMQDQPVIQFFSMEDLLLPDRSVTDAAGVYWHNCLAPGTYKVTVQYFDYMPAMTIITVVKDEITDKTIRLDY
ncbi:carboxypeptidase regulatory-like domain-containing protein [Planctomycetota bacterium]